MTSYVQLFLETGRTFCLTTTLKEVCVFGAQNNCLHILHLTFKGNIFLNFWDLMWVSGETHFPCHFFRRKLKWLLNLSSLSHIEPRHRFCTKDGNYLSSGKVIFLFRVMLLWAYKNVHWVILSYSWWNLFIHLPLETHALMWHDN